MAHCIGITRPGSLWLHIEDEYSTHTVPLDDCLAIWVRGSDGESLHSLEDLPLYFNIADLCFANEDLAGRLMIHSSRTDRPLYCWKLKASPMTETERHFLLELMDDFMLANIPPQFKAITHQTVHDVEEYAMTLVRPMSIAKLRAGLDDQTYRSVQQFRSDFYRIEKNSAQWSPDDLTMSMAAQDLNNVFEREMAIFLASPSEYEDTPSPYTEQGSQGIFPASSPQNGDTASSNPGQGS